MIRRKRKNLESFRFLELLRQNCGPADVRVQRGTFERCRTLRGHVSAIVNPAVREAFVRCEWRDDTAPQEHATNQGQIRWIIEPRIHLGQRAVNRDYFNAF